MIEQHRKPGAVRFAALFKSDKQTDQVTRFNAIFDAIEGVSGDLFKSVKKLDPEVAIREKINNLEKYEQFRSIGINDGSRGRSSHEGGSGISKDSGSTDQRSQEDGDADSGRVTAPESRTETGSEQITKSGRDIAVEKESTKFVENKDNEKDETGLGNTGTVESGSGRTMVDGREKEEAMSRTIQAAYTGGSVDSILSIEEREDLE